MALFSKPPAKKPGPAAGQPRPQVVPGRSPSAREVASHAAKKAPAGGSGRQAEPPSEITVSEGSLIEWASPGQPSFEVAQANPGLCAVLEDAALRFASGHAAKARELLEQGVQTDHDTKISPLAWLALFDLQQRAGDKSAFDQFSLQYVVQFERSAPVWEATEKPQGPPRLAGGYVGLTGKLTAAVATQLEPLKRAMTKQAPEARVDMMSVTGFDDEGARILANALGEARRKKFPLQLQRVEKLKPALDAALKQGREGGEGAWLLSLELLQWTNAHAAFEDRAVEYAVTFELSPPSWEPPPTAAKAVAATAAATNGADANAESEALCWTGVMAGSAVPQLGRLSEHASGRSVIQVDMTDVERIDFVCAGALLNAINRVEAQRKSVQIIGATPIIRALLLLIGVSPRHFVKKA
jgi:ABC-type transporter Mla MlaB component